MEQSRNAYRVLVGKPEGKRPLGRPRRRWEDNIKMDLREVERQQIQMTFAKRLNAEYIWGMHVIIHLRKFYRPVWSPRNWKLRHIKLLYYRLYRMVVKIGLSRCERSTG